MNSGMNLALETWDSHREKRKERFMQFQTIFDQNLLKKEESNSRLRGSMKIFTD